MEKHLLLTISEDQSAMYGVGFVKSFFAQKEQKDKIRLTLFYIEPSSGNVNRKIPKEYEDQCDFALDKARLSLIDSGFREENIQCMQKRRRLSKAKDIINEGNKGLYDCLILGRRGSSRLQELFVDSVSIKVLEGERKSPIWICRRIDPERRNVLVCVDGSEQALHVVDHVGFFLAEEPGHRITLLHVQQPESDSLDIFQKARASLSEHGIDAERIEEKSIQASNIAAAIKKQADDGKYSAVATGYTGAGKSGVLSIGSVSTKLLYELESSALWIA